MARKDWSGVVREKVKSYKRSQIWFTKLKLLEWLCRRNNTSLEEMKDEILTLDNMVFVEKQEAYFESQTEERFRLYLVYSGSKGRCYVLRFNHDLKIITVFPLGRATLRKYERRFK